MDVPPRDSLLDIEWLIRTHVTEGFAALVDCVRRGAEMYGGPVTAIADALPRFAGPAADRINLREMLAYRLLSGSWTPDAARLREYPVASTGIPWILPPEKRAELMAKYRVPPEPRLIDLRQLRLISPLDRAWVGHTDGIWSCDVSRDGAVMVSASRDGDVAAWDLERGTLVARAKTGAKEIRDCAVLPDARRVISAHASGRISVWDLRTMTSRATFVVPRSTPRRVRRFAISPQGARLAVAGSEAIEFWDLNEFKRIDTLPLEMSKTGKVLSLSFSAESRLTVVRSIGDDLAEFVTWDVTTHQEVDRHSREVSRVNDLERVVAHGRWLVGTSSATTMVMGIEASDPVISVPMGAFGQALAVSSNASVLATCGADPANREAAVWIWSLPDLREMWQCNLQDLGCRDIVCALAFAPDQRTLIIAGWEGVLRRIVLPESISRHPN